MRGVSKWTAGYVIPTRAQCLCYDFTGPGRPTGLRQPGLKGSPCCRVGWAPGMYVEIASGMVEQWNTFLRSTCTVLNQMSVREAQLLPSDGKHWMLPSDLCCKHHLQQTALRRRVSGLLRSAHSLPQSSPAAAGSVDTVNRGVHRTRSGRAGRARLWLVPPLSVTAGPAVTDRFRQIFDRFRGLTVRPDKVVT